MPWENPYAPSKQVTPGFSDEEWDNAGPESAAFSDKEWDDAGKKTAATTPAWEMQKDIDSMGTGQRLLVGIGAGMYNAGKGIQQTGATALNKLGLVDKSTVDRITAEGTKAKQQYDILGNQSRAASIGNVIGNAAPYAVLPGSSLRTAVGLGAAMGGMEFVPEGEADGGNTRLKNVGAGAIGGAVGLGVGRAGEAVLRKTGNFLTNTIPAEARQVQELAKKYGIPISFQDLTRRKNPVAGPIGTTLEKLPGGMGEFREAQHDAAFSATKDFVNSFFPGTEDWSAAAKAGVERGAKTVKTVAGKLYDKVSGLADQLGVVPTPNTLDALDRLIAQEGASKIPNEKLLRALTGVREKLTPSANLGGGNAFNLPPNMIQQLQSKIAASGGNPLIAGVTDNSFTNMRQFMSKLNGLIRDAQSGNNAIVGSAEMPALMELKRALQTDMDQFANNAGGELKTLYEKANKYYRENVVPYRTNKILPQIERETDPDKIFRLFVNGTKDVGSPQVLYKALSPKGRRAVEYGILKEAFETAVEKEGTVFSPAKFARQLEIRSKALGVFFPQQRKAEVQGFMNLMRHVERAGQYAENPPTGQRNLWNFILTGGPALGGGAAYMGGHPGWAGGMAAGAGMSYVTAKGMSWLFTSPSGRRFLLAASKTQPGKGMDKLISRLAPQMGAAAAVQGDASDYVEGKISDAILPPPQSTAGQHFMDTETGKQVYSDGERYNPVE